MAVTFTNNWKNILDKLRNVLRTEYKGSLPVYIGDEEISAGNQFIRLEPVGSDLVEYQATAEIREFTVNVFYVFSEANVKKASLDHILRFVSRIEALVHDNMSMTLTDNSSAFNCRMDSCSLNQGDENEYIVVWDYKCMHLGNVT